MNAPDEVPVADITPKTIKLTWSAISSDEDTGRDTVLYYELQWFNYETEQWDVLTAPAETLPDLAYTYTFIR
jgi:hypothetical protein